MDRRFDGHVRPVGAEPPAPSGMAAQQDRATIARQRGLDPGFELEADGVGGGDGADHLLLAGGRVQTLLGAKLVQPLVEIETALMQQAEIVNPAVVFGFQPDRALAVAALDVDMQRAGDQALTEQLALPAAQRGAGRGFAQRQGRMARGQAQALPVGGARRPAAAGDQTVAPADDLERQRRGAGG